MTLDPAPSTDAPAFLTVTELAERWRVSDEQIHRLCRNGRLPYITLPTASGQRGLKRFRLEDIETFEHSRPEGADDETVGAV